MKRKDDNEIRKKCLGILRNWIIELEKERNESRSSDKSQKHKG